ncbi:MAG TPA: glycine betaine ABC transporter substrate-binding protein, partial [Candidatus Eisenbacteria bacterium]
GARIEHVRELGGTRILWSALLRGDIDVYAEYTGTLREEILGGGGGTTIASLAAALDSVGVGMSAPLGFNDTYALGMTRRLADSLGIRTIADLAGHPEIRYGLSHEFLDREDGWPGLARAYALPTRHVTGLDHELAYRALMEGQVAVTDLYSTDAEIRRYDLVVLEDVRRWFPEYQAVWVWRRDLVTRAPSAVAALRSVEGRIDDDAMVAMNAAVRIDRKGESRVAAAFLDSIGVVPGIDSGAAAGSPSPDSRWERVGRRTVEHLAMVFASLLMAVVTGVPLGILAARHPVAGRLLLGVTGMLQTIPSLALLVFMLPWLGIGWRPALAALFLYGLFPIVRGTVTGLAGLPGSLRESAEALGLPDFYRLRRVELPLASRSILSGIKTSAVINVGTATLGALVGAGGYGQPILTGIRLDDMGLILEGAIPAALLALLMQTFFDSLEHLFVSEGLRDGGGHP